MTLAYFARADAARAFFYRENLRGDDDGSPEVFF